MSALYLEPSTSQLSKRQREILALRASGLSLKEIATQLDVSLKTVQFHWARLQAKTGLYDVALLTQFALVHGFAVWRSDILVGAAARVNVVLSQRAKWN